jgi:pyridoxine 5-phosphate synthase
MIKASSLRPSSVRLGVNIDHVATIRNARGGFYPDPIRAAHLAIMAGADSITAHLREDRRHIRDEDILRLRREILTPLNLEMAATEEMRDIALRIRPHAVCLVPEKREERTTEGGLDVVGGYHHLAAIIAPLQEAHIRVSLFIEPEKGAIETASKLGVPVVELHTGTYCEAPRAEALPHFERIKKAAAYGTELGLEIHAGHGLNYETAQEIASIPEIIELNIGHFLIGEAMFVGLDEAVITMRNGMNAGRIKMLESGPLP